MWAQTPFAVGCSNFSKIFWHESARNIPPEVLRELLLAGSGVFSWWYFHFELNIPIPVRPLVGDQLCSEETFLTATFLLFLVESGNDLITSGPIDVFSFAFCMGNGKMQLPFQFLCCQLGCEALTISLFSGILLPHPNFSSLSVGQTARGLAWSTLTPELISGCVGGDRGRGLVSPSRNAGGETRREFSALVRDAVSGFGYIPGKAQFHFMAFKGPTEWS